MEWSVQTFNDVSADSDTAPGKAEPATTPQATTPGAPSAERKTEDKSDSEATNPFRSLHCNTLLHVTMDSVGVVLNTPKGFFCACS